MRRNSLCRALVGLMFLITAVCAPAASVYWTNSAGGDFLNAANWSGVPSATNFAFFTNHAAAYTVTASGTATNANLTFSGQGSAVTIDAGTYAIWATNALTVNGNAGQETTLILAGGTLAVTNVSTQQGALSVGYGAGLRGTLIVSNGFFSAGYTRVGSGSAGSFGSLLIYGGTNNLIATSNNTLNADFRLGESVSSTGRFVLAASSAGGAVVYATNNSTYVGGISAGSSGVGFFTVSNGTYYGKDAYLGSGAGSQGTMSLFGGNTFFSGTLSVGGTTGSGTGTLLMAGSGPFLSTAGLKLGNYAGGSGSMTATNAIFLSSGNVLVGGPEGSTGSFRQDGGTSTVGAIFYVGHSTPGNSLLVTNGGLLSSGNGYVGFKSSFNTAVIAGGATRSKWTLGNAALTVGAAGNTGNVLRVEAGGIVEGIGAVNVGAGANGVGHQIIITNGGLFLTTNAGAVAIGNGSGSCSNVIQVIGAGSVWTNTGQLNLTSSSGGSFSNSLIIANGGRYYGTAQPVVGDSGYGNTFAILSGGSAVYPGSVDLLLAKTAASSNNLYLVDGPGSLSLGFRAVTVGVGSYSRIVISGGGVMSNTVNSTIIIGAGAGGGNQLLVTGPGSFYSTVSPVVLGTGSGFANSLTITNGARMVGTSVTLGSPVGACSSNAMTVVGSGSTVSLSGVINVGAGTNQANSLVITNGAAVTSVGATIGTTTSRFNTVLVAGGDETVATWNLSAGLLTIGGGNSTGNVVTLNPGSVVTNGAVTVGAGAGALSNQLVLNGGALDNVSSLVVNSNNTLSFVKGLLGVTAMTFTNGPFTVGDGTAAAVLKSLPGGTLSFTNSLLVSANAGLVCSGTVNCASDITAGTNAAMMVAGAVTARAGVVLDAALLTGNGTASGGGTGVILTNGGAVNPGLDGAGALTIAGSNLTWCSGGVYQCEITNMSLNPGVGWDLLNVSSQLVFSGGSPKFVIRLDSRDASAAAFDTNLTYTLRIANYGGLTGFNTNQIDIDASSDFSPAGGAWSLVATNNALWLAYAGAAPSGGAHYVWNVPSNGNWSANGNWSGGSAPTAGGNATNVLSFGDNGTPYSSSNDLAGTFLLNRLALANISGKTNSIGGNPLSFAADGAVAPRLDYLSGAGCFVVSNAITLSGGAILGGEGNGLLVLASNVSGAQPLLKQGPWTLALQASNQFANPVVVTNGGMIRMDHNLALGTNTVIVSNGGVLNATAALVLGNRALVRHARVAGAGSLWTNNAGLTIGSNATLTVDGARLANSGWFYMENTAAAAPCGLLITNGGVMAYTNEFKAGTTSSSNTLMITGPGSLLAGPGDVINGGTTAGWMTFGGSGNAGNLLQVDNGATFTNARVTMYGANRLVVTNGSRFFSTTFSLFDTCQVAVVGGAGGTSVFSANMVFNMRGNGNVLLVDGGGVDGSAVATPAALSVGGVAQHANRIRVQNKGSLITSSISGYAIGAAGGQYNALEVGKAGYARLSCGPLSGGTGIGRGGQANYNYVVVEDAGSVLEFPAGAGHRFEIGFEGTGPAITNYGNMLLVRNQGLLTNAVTLSIASFVNGGQKSTNCLNNGILVSSSGQVFSAGPCQLAWNFGVTGNFVKVTDPGSYWSMGNQSFTIGHTNALGLSTNNYLMITSNGVMENVGNLVVYSNNQAWLNGGTLGLVSAGISNGLPFVAGDGTQAATLKVQGGTLSMPSGLVITNSATLTGRGTCLAATTVFGTLSPGLDGAGTLNNNGSLTLTNAATVKVEMAAGTTPGAGWDLLAVTNGLLTLGGTLSVTLTNGFSPSASAKYVVMTNYGPLGVTGAFSNPGGLVPAYTNLTGRIAGQFLLNAGPQGVVLEGWIPAKVNPGTLLIIQ